jgi:hypothetical protein
MSCHSWLLPWVMPLHCCPATAILLLPIWRTVAIHSCLTAGLRLLLWLVIRQHGLLLLLLVLLLPLLLLLSTPSAASQI